MKYTYNWNMTKQNHTQEGGRHLEPKVPKKPHKRIGKSFTNILKQTEPKNSPMSGYTTIAVVHNKFSSLVSSETVYSIRYSPKARHNNK
jgi:hypothetical protein